VVPRLKEIDAPLADEVHDPVLLREPARPGARGQILQWLRLADARERISQDGLDQIESPQCELSIGLDPIAKILQKLRLEDRGTLV
jgi:hypothetical protein